MSMGKWGRMMNLRFVLSVLFVAAVFLSIWILFKASTEVDELLPTKEYTPPKEGVEAQQWVRFVDPKERFQVEMPSAPQYSQDRIPLSTGVGTATYELYTVQTPDESAYVISVVTYPYSFKLGTPFELAQEVMGSYLRDAGKLQESRASQHQGYQAFDFLIQADDKAIRGRLITREQMVYLLMWIPNWNDFDEDVFSYFLESFVLESKF